MHFQTLFSSQTRSRSDNFLASPRLGSSRNQVLLVSFDGFRWDYLTKFNRQLENFARLKKSGVSIKGGMGEGQPTEPGVLKGAGWGCGCGHRRGGSAHWARGSEWWALQGGRFHIEGGHVENVHETSFMTFLDASSHLYKRVCPSVRRSVVPSVRRLVGRSRFRQKQGKSSFSSKILSKEVY